MTVIDAYNEERPRRRARQLYDSGLYQKAGIIRRRNIALVHQKTTGDYLSGTFQQKLKKALPTQDTRKFAPYFAKLDALATDRTLLVGCTEVPSTFTLTRARAILHQFETEALEPTRVVASAEGGVAICFASGEKYSDIECLNSGEILGVISDRRNTPVVWEIDPSAGGLAGAVARIRDFLNGASRTYDAERQTG